MLSKVELYLNTSALSTVVCTMPYFTIILNTGSLRAQCTLQNKAVKIVGNGTWNDRATSYYAKLKLQDSVKLETAAFVYNYKSGQLLSTFQNYFTALTLIHVKPTRATSSHNTFVPFFKLRNFKGLLNIKVQKYGIYLTLNLKILNL